MNFDTLTQSLQKGFRTTLGAAAFVVDFVQHPEQRDENITRLRTDLNQLMEEWAIKGEMTEQEARKFVETLVNQEFSPTNQSARSSTMGTTPTAPPDVQADLKDLTAQITALRMELEKLREENL
jgi:polyhydroxyalkanoate synthesis regulator phasin